MRTLKPFTEAAAAVLLPLLLTACVSLGDSNPSTKSSAPAGPSDQSVDGSVSSEIISPNPRPADQPLPSVRAEVASEFESAVALMRDGRYPEAEVLLLDITAEQPELAGPWINLGQVYVALDQPEEARRAFEAATVANPWNCTAHNELGLLSRQNGDFEAAERHYLRCIENAPGHGPAYLNLGILYELYLGRLSDALSYYRTYQTLLGEPDRRVQGWVMDLERRLGV